jgi:enoyl-CoA hydratase
MGKLRVEDRGEGVRLLTLDDPGKRNAMGPELAAEVTAVVEGIGGEEDARVLVVTGAGDAFCAGADLPAMFGAPERPTAEIRAGLQTYYEAFWALLGLQIPTIAAVNGPAVGAGLNLAMSCDVRIAGPSASFGATFARIGLHPGGGCTWFLVRALGASRALRLLLLGDTIEAEQAISWGLAEGVEADPVAAALDLAERFAAVEPQLARHIKQAVRLAVDPGDLDAVVAFESWAQAASASSPQLQEWVERFKSRS